MSGAILDGIAPVIQLDQATLIGVTNELVESYLGIPYAEPPVNDRRLRSPQLKESYSGVLNAGTFGNQCVQQALIPPLDLPPEVLLDVAPFVARLIPNPAVPQSEDCLNLNVIRPANTKPDDKLPVLFWIHGGGFVTGSNAIPFYDGSAVVQRSIEIGKPVIFVAINYRLNVFGSLGGKEIREAGLGNLGLQDQRVALRWVNRFIHAFGGDPSKVTIWGESAGAISVFFHMFANGGDTEGLFRAGIMNSGSSVPTGDITDIQSTYDFVVDQVGCSDERDSLACLRTVSTLDLLMAANKAPTLVGYTGLAIPFITHADGTLVTMPPEQLPLKAEMANVPFIIGDVKDEGTLFSLANFNVTTDDEFATYISQTWFPGSSVADFDKLLQLYPADPAEGSPFDTGDAYAFTSQHKRIAAVQGDWFFQAPRRQLLDAFADKRTAYNFLSVRNNFRSVGYAHSTDLLNAFGPGDMTDFYVRFVNDLDPNGGSGVQWPKYNTSTRSTLQFNDGRMPLSIVVDDERRAGTDELLSLSMQFPV